MIWDNVGILGPHVSAKALPNEFLRRETSQTT